jgi:hypothetical protein
VQANASPFFGADPKALKLAGGALVGPDGKHDRCPAMKCDVIRPDGTDPLRRNNYRIPHNQTCFRKECHEV